MASLSLIHTITEIQVGLASNKQKIVCKNTKISSKLCSFFFAEGLIHKYFKNNSNKYELISKVVRNINVVKKLHIISKPALKKYYSVYRIKTLLWKSNNYIYLISAPAVKIKEHTSGFINQYDAVKQGVGGEILLKIKTL